MTRNERLAERIALIPAIGAGGLPILVKILGGDPLARYWLIAALALLAIWIACAGVIVAMFRRRAFLILGASAPIALLWFMGLTVAMLFLLFACGVSGGCFGMVM